MSFVLTFDNEGNMYLDGNPVEESYVTIMTKPDHYHYIVRLNGNKMADGCGRGARIKCAFRACTGRIPTDKWPQGLHICWEAERNDFSDFSIEVTRYTTKDEVKAAEKQSHKDSGTPSCMPLVRVIDMIIANHPDDAMLKCIRVFMKSNPDNFRNTTMKKLRNDPTMRDAANKLPGRTTDR